MENVNLQSSLKIMCCYSLVDCFCMLCSHVVFAYFGGDVILL